METTPIIPGNKNMRKIIIVILVLVLIVIAYIMMSNKTGAPLDVNNPDLQNIASSQEEAKQMVDDINDATIFDSEASLIEIDKQFQ